MRNAAIVGLVLASVVLGFIYGLYGLGGSEVQAQQDCTVIQTFQGTGIQETPPFQVQSNTWRVSYNWTATDSQFGGIFQIFVNNAETGELASLVSAEQPGSGESFVNAGAGSYYLNINTALAEWTVTVEDCGQRDGGGPTPPPPPPPPPPPFSPPPPGPPPPPPGNLMEAGGPSSGPLPLMPNGTCPRESPTLRDGACYSS